MYDIGPFLFTGAGWACGIPSVFTQIYLSSTVLCISGSLELVPWYCNNIYLNSVLFEVRNVITSLLGLVIVSHLKRMEHVLFDQSHIGSWGLDHSLTYRS
jgi:hypothetical protein